MSALHKRRLMILSAWLILLTIVVGLVLFGLRQNVSLFFSPSDIAKGQVALGQVIRMGGMVVEGSIHTSSTGRVSFLVTDYKNQVHVDYQGVLPDLFRDKQGVVVKGILKKKGLFEANEVLAKHDANYMPREVAAMLKVRHCEP